jgi:hypothetical protein
LKILPGFCPIIGDTEAEARDWEHELHERIQPDYGLQRLSNLFKLDMTGYALDGPLPFDDLPDQASINGHRGRHQLYIDMARRENLTIRDLIRRTAASRGHFSLAGTPVQIADEMEKWLHAGAADGSIRWCLSCRIAGCSARIIPGTRCVSIMACSGLPPSLIKRRIPNKHRWLNPSVTAVALLWRRSSCEEI